MKKLLCCVMVCLLMGSVACAEIDLSGMTYEELVALKDQINLAIWNSEEWQEVTVPQGVWKIGEDIPEGHWTITCAGDGRATIEYGDELNESGKSLSWFGDIYYSERIYSKESIMYDENSSKVSIDLEVKEGNYIIIDSGNVIFTPYTGKPSLGFK